MRFADNWINFDASPNLFMERLPILGLFYIGNKSEGKIRFPKEILFGDIVKGLPLRERSVAGVYSSHVLEHLSLKDFRIALQNTFNILEDNGIFRFVVPDLKELAIRYVNSNDPVASISFLEKTSLGLRSKPENLKQFIQSLFGNSQHLWMWDYDSIKVELEEVGFVGIREAKFGDSVDTIFKYVECQDRYIDAVAVECRRPKTIIE
jgi:predicted SAM-dependent methyltransferase